MQILAFETSAKACSVALLEEDVLLGESYLNNGKTHSRTLLHLAQALLQDCDRRPQDIDCVACAAGPGSFTGVRIGMAAAKGFCWGVQRPILAVSTLEGMAYNGASFDGLVCCAMDARRQQVYHALFRAENGVLTRLVEDCAISLEQLQAELAQYGEERIFLVGDGASLCYNTLENGENRLVLAPEQFRQQRASGIALAARQMYLAGQTQAAAAVVPNYLRLSQAERERLERNQKREGETS